MESKVFTDGGKYAVQSLRQALAELLSVMRVDPSEPQEIARRFGLDKTLTWRISRVVREENAWESVPHIPRRPSMQAFLRTMAKHGAPDPTVELVRTALDGFEEFIRTHTGDRETLEAMLGPTATRSGAKRMETFRKQAVQANSAIFGVRARTQFAARFAYPGAADGELMTAVLIGLVDFRRLRPEVRWGVATVEEWGMPGGRSQPKDLVISAMDPAARGKLPLLAEFCSKPLAMLKTADLPGGRKRLDIAEGPVGNTAAATVVLGWKWNEPVSCYESFPGEYGEHGLHMSTPVEVAIFDLFVHKSLVFAHNLEPRLVNELPHGFRAAHGDSATHVLPSPEQVIDLSGEGTPDLTTVEVPRYREMVELACGSIGFPLGEFKVFRYRIKYPPIPTLALLRHPLLPRPK